MVSFEDDDDNGAASPDTSSENDADETMEDVDAEGENEDEDNDNDGDGDGDRDGDGDIDAEGQNDDEDGDNEEDEDQDDADSPSQSQAVSRRQSRTTITAHVPTANGIADADGSQVNGAHPAVRFSTPSPRTAVPDGTLLPYRPSVRPEALTAITYDIVPTIAAPHSTSINALAVTPDNRLVFTGGTDGYIRKFNFVDTVNGKLMLTVAQRHPFVDSVVKAGVLSSYWENEESSFRTPPMSQTDESTSLSPVYSLAVHNQALWLLSGLESGGINLQTVRHSEGQRITCLRKHTSAVSVLVLAQDERSVLSGSWDKTINDWDLNAGQVKRSFDVSGGQISAIEPRPMSSLPVPEVSSSPITMNGTFSSNNASKPSINGVLTNGVAAHTSASIGTTNNDLKDESSENADAPGSPDDDSLFGDKASLFGDAGEGVAAPPMPGLDDDEDDEFSRAIANGIQQAENEDAQGDIDMTDAGGPVQPPDTTMDAAPTAPASAVQDANIVNGVPEPEQAPVVNGLPHADEDAKNNGTSYAPSDPADKPPSSDTTFLDASIDGTIRIWDRRQQNPVARITPQRTTPPWCMGVCWAPDGNTFYAGRRNGTVEEYSLHKGLSEPRRTFKFPAGSGPVSAVRAMPNGKHLVCASHDILRLYDLEEHEATTRRSAVPFLIVPGHRTGVISQLYVDPTCAFMITTAGNRGWEGNSTEVLLGYEIGCVGK